MIQFLPATKTLIIALVMSRLYKVSIHMRWKFPNTSTNLRSALDMNAFFHISDQVLPNLQDFTCVFSFWEIPDKDVKSKERKSFIILRRRINRIWSLCVKYLYSFGSLTLEAEALWGVKDIQLRSL